MRDTACTKCGKLMGPVPNVICHVCKRPFCRDCVGYYYGQWLCFKCLARAQDTHR